MKIAFEQLISLGLFSPELMEEHYAQYQADPGAVDVAWRELFDQLKNAEASEEERASKPELPPEDFKGLSVLYYPRVEVTVPGKDYRIAQLIDAYRTYGHLLANVNPIAVEPQSEPYQLNIERFGFTRQDLASHFPTYELLQEETAPLLNIINTLRSIYCDRLGFDFMHVQHPELEKWLIDQIEPIHCQKHLTNEQKQQILQHLNKSELFESFLHMRYVGQKRFSLEGAETLIPMIVEMVDRGAEQEVEEFIFGMSHRGRLNVLCNIFDKSYAEIFSEFEEGKVPASIEGSGDVKYHKGFYSEVKSVHGRQVKLTLTPNPSHLESVNAVVEGLARARQDLLQDEKQRHKVLPILVHGDAALSGQGVVYESMQFNSLRGYATGGTIHLVINNQIGFTTLPKDCRSTTYCTDIARTFNAPVFHVNAEDPEGCVFAMQLAVDIRQKFHIDVFLDLNCYRKYGHNESDEPSFTQPHIYRIIRNKQPIRELYRDELLRQRVLKKDAAQQMESDFKKALHDALESQKNFAGAQISAEESSAPVKKAWNFQQPPTGVAKDVLQQVAAQVCQLPKSFNLHPKLAALNKERLAMVQEEQSEVDWGMAELLAYGSLLGEGMHVRLTGQDTCRGTFTHRHAMFVDQADHSEFIPLQHIKMHEASGKLQGGFEVYNSPLSEYAALGFEFGYSVGKPEALVIWEAQFGDFGNGAQVVVDQYISASEQKWNQKSGLTLFLPHGYEGQGPEHSSARVERFLALAGDQNMQIVNPTSPAQFFHLLRRQAVQPFKKPLITFTPKGLLRHPACLSRFQELTVGAFQEILDDPAPPNTVERLLLCSGRIFYDLMAERSRVQNSEAAIIRIEQLYPLDIERLKQLISKYSSGLNQLIWVQEEPSNMGAWNYMRPILRGLLSKELEPVYAGRPRSASTAVGLHALHKKEQAAIMNAAFRLSQ
jgi:2-oxoglutarate dehydrogenase E1 component